MELLSNVQANNALGTMMKWSNDNQGVVSILIFLLTLAVGWFSGLFTALHRRPKFRVNLLLGPTYCCTFPTGEKRDGFDIHRTGIALYLQIANVGSAPSSIESISIAYHWNVLRRLSCFKVNPLWIKYGIGWFWLHNQSAIMADFQASIGENTKVYPFLFQRSIISSESAKTFLEVGRSTSGVIYFEQSDSWGACYPRTHRGSSQIKIRVQDVFGKSHCAKFRIPSVSLDEARKYNPAFGKTLAELRQTPLPCDCPQNEATVG